MEMPEYVPFTSLDEQLVFNFNNLDLSIDDLVKVQPQSQKFPYWTSEAYFNWLQIYKLEKK